VSVGQDLGRPDVQEEAAEETQIDVSARRVELWRRSMRLTVFLPSAKSWARTANVTMKPVSGDTWKAKPMPSPSRKLWPIRATAERTGKRARLTMSLTVLNPPDTVATYNFLSTCAGTHFVPTRRIRGEIGLAF